MAPRWPFTSSDQYPNYSFQDLVVPHDHLTLAHDAIHERELRYGGPRFVLHYEIEERLRSLL